MADDQGGGCYPLVRVDSGVSGVTITENEIYGGYRGINLRHDSHDNTITDNVIHDNSTGISVGGSQNNTISGNEIYNNNDGILLRQDGCNGDGECFGDVSGNVISAQNNIHDNSSYGIYGENGITFSELTITDNTITNNSSGGIYFNGFSNATLTITENTVTNNLSTGIYLSGSSAQISVSTVTISGNTISSNNGDGIYADVIVNSTFDVLNNIEINSNSGNGIYVCAEGYCAEGSTVTISGNTSIDGNSGKGIYLYDVRDTSTVNISNNAISNSGDAGIYLDQSVSGVSITQNTISGNGLLSLSTGIVVYNASGNLANENSISDNSDI